MITYNVDLLNRNDLEHSFFHLDRQDPTIGFAFDATRFHGSTYPAVSNTTPDFIFSFAVVENDPNSLHIRLLVASHLAAYLRGQLEEQKGYTATVGISTSKILAKLVGNTYKPNNQTTLLPPYTAAEQGAQSNVVNFLDTHEIRKIPGIGSKLSQKIKSYLNSHAQPKPNEHASDTTRDDTVTVRDVRLFPGMGPVLLEKVLGGPGSPKGLGMKVWGLINGVDNSEVLQARDLPTQISIEDTYGGLNTLEEIRRELVSLVISLIRRMRADLTEKDYDVGSGRGCVHKASASRETPNIRWLARPRTVRLSTRPRPPLTSNGAQAHSLNRISRSAPLPQYIFHLDACIDALAEQLVHEHVMSMFRKIHPERTGWNIRLLNIAVTNMVDAAGERKHSSGRDIEKMFQKQDIGRRPAASTLMEQTSREADKQTVGVLNLSSNDASSNYQERPQYHTGDNVWEESDEDEDMLCVACVSCGALIPHFALVAHEMYHSTRD
jgi:DNA polymerase iota